MYLDQTLEQPECKQCPAGKYSIAYYRTVCVNCPSGYYTEQVAIGHAEDCTDPPARACAAGKYSDTEGATSEDVCVYCPVGKYQSGIGRSACNDCNEEKTTGVPSGATRCVIDCPNDGYSIIDGYCTKCPEGKYLTNGDTACKDCPVGKYSNGVSCFACLPGHARLSCEKCPPGRYTGWEAVDECHQCGQGYQDEHGQGNCKQCPAGRVSSTDKTKCVTCPFGEYSDEVDLITCKTCPSGRQHTGIIGQKDSKCTGEETIGKDTYIASDDATYQGFQESLNNVSAGTYTAEPTNCPANSYKNTFGGSCKNCPQGLYNGADDPSIKIVGINDWANPCKFCPAGEVSTSGTCTKCPFQLRHKFKQNGYCKDSRLSSNDGCVWPFTCDTDRVTPDKHYALARNKFDRDLSGPFDTPTKCMNECKKRYPSMEMFFMFEGNNRDGVVPPTRATYCGCCTDVVQLYNSGDIGGPIWQPTNPPYNNLRHVNNYKLYELNTPNQGILRDYPSEECRYAACPAGSSALDGECSECPAGTYWESDQHHWSSTLIGTTRVYFMNVNNLKPNLNDPGPTPSIPR